MGLISTQESTGLSEWIYRISGWTIKSMFLEKRWKMTWSACFPKIYIRHNKLSVAMFLRTKFYGVWQRQRHVPFSNLSNFKAEILSGSFDSRHLSSTTAVHEGKAIPYLQIFTDIHMNCYAIFWLLSSSFDHQPSCFASSSRSMSFNVDRYEPHLCGLLFLFMRKESYLRTSLPMINTICYPVQNQSSNHISHNRSVYIVLSPW